MDGSNSFLMLLRVGLSLGFVMGLIWLSARMARRRGLLRAVESPQIELLARRSVGRRANLLVIEAEGQRFLVGSTDTSVSLLAELGRAATTEPSGTVERSEVSVASVASVATTAPSGEPESVGSSTVDLTVESTEERVARTARERRALLDSIREATIRR